jgi:hypothetical protein
MSDQGDAHKRWYQPKDIPNFAVGILTLVAIVVYACFTKQQVTETQNANNIAKTALTEANKAFVGFDQFNSNSFTSDVNGLHRHVGFIWRNFGNTPALSPTIYPCKPIIEDNQAPPPYKCDLDSPPVAGGAIGAKQPLIMDGPIVADNDLSATQDGKKAVYIIAYISYTDSVSFDQYGNSITRFTGHCVRVIQTKYTINPSAPSNMTIPPAMEAQAPLVGKDCAGFKYCVDKQCPEMPKWGS